MATLAHPSPGLQTSTLAALRYPNFRLYFSGQLVSLSGSWMQITAQAWLVYHLAVSEGLPHPELWLGIVACAGGLPSLLLSPFAGVLVDRFNRRDILLYSQAAQMTLAVVLAALTFAGVIHVYHIVGLAFLLGFVSAIDAPSRQAIIVDLVGHDDLSSGIALNSIMFNGSRIFGPALAGVLLASVGAAWCFLFNAISFLAVIVSLLKIKSAARPKNTEALQPLRRLREGLSFSRQHPTIAPILLLAVFASLFTINISTQFAAFADVSLKSPTEGLAVVSTALGVGAVFAGLLMTTLGRRFGRGRVVTAMIALVMVIGIAFTRTTALPVAAALIAVYGFSIILQFVTMNTLIQSEVPDQFRGRVLSLYTLTFFGVAPFGALLLGFLASAIGVPNAMLAYALVGGVANLIVLARSPQVRALL